MAREIACMREIAHLDELAILMHVIEHRQVGARVEQRRERPEAGEEVAGGGGVLSVTHNESRVPDGRVGYTSLAGEACMRGDCNHTLPPE